MTLIDYLSFVCLSIFLCRCFFLSCFLLSLLFEFYVAGTLTCTRTLCHDHAAANGACRKTTWIRASTKTALQWIRSGAPGPPTHGTGRARRRNHRRWRGTRGIIEPWHSSALDQPYSTHHHRHRSIAFDSSYFDLVFSPIRRFITNFSVRTPSPHTHTYAHPHSKHFILSPIDPRQFKWVSAATI